jgi:hypothetical protein
MEVTLTLNRNRSATTYQGAAMTLTNASSSARGRRAKFTPQAIEKIKELLAQGASRDEIANSLDVTVGSLQVTCSRLGISLRRIILQNGSARHTLDSRGRSIPIPGVVGITHVRKLKTEEVSVTAADTAPLAKFAILMRHRGKEVVTDVPLTSHAICALALNACVRGLGIAELLGQFLAAAIEKYMIREILRDEVPPSAA